MSVQVAHLQSISSNVNKIYKIQKLPWQFSIPKLSQLIKIFQFLFSVPLSLVVPAVVVLESRERLVDLPQDGPLLVLHIRVGAEVKGVDGHLPGKK